MGGVTLNSANILSGGSFTPGAGSNRRIVAMGHVRRDTGTPVYSATFGGVAMTADVVTPLSSDDQLLIYSLTDLTGIPGGASVLSVTATGGTILDQFHGQIYTLGGVDQTSLDSGFTSTGTASGTTATTVSLTNANGSVRMAVMRDSTGDSVTGPAGWTDDRDDTSQGGMVWLGHQDNAASATATYTWTALTTNWMWGTVAYKAAVAATRAPSLPLVGIGLAPLAWIIERRNRLAQEQATQGNKSRIFLPKFFRRRG